MINPSVGHSGPRFFHQNFEDQMDKVPVELVTANTNEQAEC